MQSIVVVLCFLGGGDAHSDERLVVRSRSPSRESCCFALKGYCLHAAADRLFIEVTI
jgi:hypothetical protein